MQRTLKIYLRFLAICYLVGALLHLADILNLRLHLSQMNWIWKIWIIALFTSDLAAGVGLWQTKKYGEVLFLAIAIAQLVAYTVFVRFFGPQTFLVVFHSVTVGIYIYLVLQIRSLNTVKKKRSNED